MVNVDATFTYQLILSSSRSLNKLRMILTSNSEWIIMAVYLSLRPTNEAKAYSAQTAIIIKISPVRDNGNRQYRKIRNATTVTCAVNSIVFRKLQKCRR